MGKVRVIIDGESRLVDEGDLEFFKRRGARETDAGDDIEVADKERRTKEFSRLDQRIAGGAEAIARGASLGLSDTFLADAGVTDPGRAAARRDELGVVGDVLEVGTLVGSALLTGGGSLVGRGLAATPAGLLARGSARAGSALAKRLGGRTSAVVAGLATEGAIDGAAFEVGSALSTATLENRELTASDVSGALFRGGLTGVLGGAAIGSGAAVLRRGAQTTKRFFKPGAAQTRAVEGSLGTHLDALLRADNVEAQALQRRLATQLGGDLSGERLLQYIDNPKVKFPDKQKVLRTYGDLVTVARKTSPEVASLLDDTGASVFKAIQSSAESQLGAAGAKNFTKNLQKFALGIEAVDLAGEAAGVDLVPLPKEASALLFLAGVGGLRGAKKKSSGLVKSLANAASQGASGQLASRVGNALTREPVVKGAIRQAGFRAGGKLVSSRTSRVADAVEGDILQLVGREQSAKGRVGRAFTRFLGATRKPGPIVALKVKDILGDVFPEDKPSKPTPGVSKQVSDFLKVQRDMRRLTQNPQQIMQRIQDSTSGLDAIDPELAVMTRDRLFSTLDFLNGKMPVNSGAGQYMFGDAYVPDPVALAAFLRYAKAATDPASIFEDLANNKLSPEAAEVAQKLHGAHLAEFIDRMAEPGNMERMAKLPVESKIQLFMLTGQVTHPSILHFKQLQETFVKLEEESQQAQQQAPAPNNSGQGVTQQPTLAQQLEAR